MQPSTLQRPPHDDAASQACYHAGAWELSKKVTEKGDRFIFYVTLFYWFRPYGESLDSLRSPFGPACGCYSAALRFSLLAQKVTKEKARPTSGFRGSSRRAIPGPSLLVWHPCQTPLSTAPPLGLLTGSKTESPELSVQKKTKRKKQGPSIAALPQCWGSFGFWCANLADDAKRPVRRPSGIVVKRSAAK